MSKDTIISKIELRQEQLENLEKSGHFTDYEIEQTAPALRIEIQSLKASLELYGMTFEQYQEGTQNHQYYFSQTIYPALQNTWNILDRNLAISKG